MTSADFGWVHRRSATSFATPRTARAMRKFRELMSRRLYNISLRIVGNSADAEEIMHDSVRIVTGEEADDNDGDLFEMRRDYE